MSASPFRCKSDLILAAAAENGKTIGEKFTSEISKAPEPRSGAFAHRSFLTVFCVKMVKNTLTRRLFRKKSGETGPQAGADMVKKPSAAGFSPVSAPEPRSGAFAAASGPHHVFQIGGRGRKSLCRLGHLAARPPLFRVGGKAGGRQPQTGAGDHSHAHTGKKFLHTKAPFFTFSLVCAEKAA
jgi:hypothetical protein